MQHRIGHTLNIVVYVNVDAAAIFGLTFEASLVQPHCRSSVFSIQVDVFKRAMLMIWAHELIITQEWDPVPPPAIWCACVVLCPGLISAFTRRLFHFLCILDWHARSAGTLLMKETNCANGITWRTLKQTPVLLTPLFQLFRLSLKKFSWHFPFPDMWNIRQLHKYKILRLMKRWILNADFGSQQVSEFYYNYQSQSSILHYEWNI